MALRLLALKACLVFISVCSSGVAASSEPIHVGGLVLLPTNAEAQIVPLTNDVEETTIGLEPSTSFEDFVSRDTEEVTDKIEEFSTTSEDDEGINPDLGSSHDLVSNLEDAVPLKDTSTENPSESDHGVEILEEQDKNTAGKTHMDDFEPEADGVEEFIVDGEGGEASLHPVQIQQNLFVHRNKVFEGEICLEEINEPEGVIIMDGVPPDSLCTGFAWTVSVGGGFSADVTINSLNVSEVNGEFMILGPGSSIEDLWEDESNPIFTAVIKNERKFRILESMNFTVFLVTNSPEGFQGGFSLSFERAVLVDTTPVPTTPGPTLPTPGANITTVITVFLGGKTPKQFNNDLVQFKGVVANMANKYALENNIETTEEATIENVVVTLITQCDVTWKYSETCVRTNISVALITLNSDNPDEFELTADHMQDMWDTMATTNSELSALGLYVYVPPNATGVMFLWVGISVGVLIIFLVFLLVVWRVEVIRDYARMTSKQETSFARDSTMSRNSVWFPNSGQHQLVPPFMDVYSEVGYVEYEPEFNGPAPISKFQTQPIVTPTPTYEPPPKYGPPLGFGGAVHFYGNTMRSFENDAFEEDEENESKEEEINTSQIKYPLSGILKKARDEDNSTC